MVLYNIYNYIVSYNNNNNNYYLLLLIVVVVLLIDDIMGQFFPIYVAHVGKV